MPPTTPPSGPPTRMAWEMVVLPPDPARTWHSKANRVSGITVVSSRNDRPGTTSVSCTWRVPCLVFIVPEVPAANGPSRVIDCTSGFHSGQVVVSDQTLHTAAGLALVSTERWLSAIPCPPRRQSCGAPPIENYVYHAGNEEADEVAEIGAPEEGGEWSRVERLGHERDGNHQANDEGDETVAVPGRRLAEAHGLAVL